MSSKSSTNIAPLTAENLKRLQDQYARTSPLPLEQRVIRWLQSIPMFIGEGQHDSQADFFAGGGNANLAQQQMAPGPGPVDPAQRYYDQQEELRAAQRASANNLMTGDMSMEAALAAGGARKDLNSARRPVRAPTAPGMPPGSSSAKYPAPMPGLERSSSGLAGRDDRSKSSKGRLCCYLKVEVSGNTQMLPIHEFDAPKELAYNFCKANNILGSVDSLTEHITTAIQNYRK